MQRFVGILLLVAGVVLFVVGMKATDSLTDRMSRFFTGHVTDTTVWYLIGGVAAVVCGLLLTTVSGSRPSA